MFPTAAPPVVSLELTVDKNKHNHSSIQFSSVQKDEKLTSIQIGKLVQSSTGCDGEKKTELVSQ